MVKNILILTAILLSSCVTQQRCYEKFPPQDTLITWHDTVYFVSLKTDTVYKTAQITDTVYASTGTAGGSAWVINDTIYLNVWQKDTVLMYRDSIKTVEVTKVVTLPCKKSPVLTKVVVIAVVLLLIVAILKFVR
jgi:hypothetical protein